MTLPATGLGTTSLGAVGGARGTAAGALRILVEFLTQYDSKAVKQLEADLQDLEQRETQASNRAVGAQNGLNRATKQKLELEKELRKIIAQSEKPATVRREIKRIQDIGVLSKAGKADLAILSKQVTGNDHLARTVSRIANEKKQIARFTTLSEKATRSETIAAEQRLIVEQQLSRFQQLKSNLPRKLGGLAIGALGGIVGGAVLGVGFAAAEALLENIGQGLKDILDPAAKARDIIKELSSEIDSLAAQFDGDRKRAVVEYFQDLGVEVDEATAALIAESVALQAGVKALEARANIQQIERQNQTIENQVRKDAISQLIEEARRRGDLQTITRTTARGTRTFADTAFYAKEAERQLGSAAEAAANDLDQQAAAAYRAERANRALAASAQLASFAEQNLISAFNRIPEQIGAGFDSQIDALQNNAGPSAQTKALEAKLEAIQSAGGGRNSEQASINEERQLILLRQRLRLLGANINLEQYSGKFLLEAINAKLKALQKEAAAQDRLNRLLDLQFRMSQKIRRNEGESISDFLERRAQENRGFLTEQRDIEREATEERLQELQDKTQDEVALAELAEREKNSLAQAGTQARIKELQKELDASRKADAAALEAKIATLQRQRDAEVKAAQDSVAFFDRALQQNIRNAIQATKTIEQLTRISAQIQGTEAALGFARSFGQALVATGAITQGQLNDLINNLQATLNLYANKRHNLITGHAAGKGPLEFAQGGVIPLNNASTVFGSNYKFGEQGSEAAVILQHKIADGLKNQATGQVGPFYMQKTNNWREEKYWMKQLVKEAIAEAMR